MFYCEVISEEESTNLCDPNDCAPDYNFGTLVSEDNNSNNNDECTPEYYCTPEAYNVCNPETDSDGGCDPHYDNW